MTDDLHRYWNTPDVDGLTRRQRKWASREGLDESLVAIAVRPCLGAPYGSGGPSCIEGSCVTCEARKRLDNP